MTLKPWHNYLKLVAPTALFTAVDIGLSNLSLEYVTLSTYTVLKSTSPLCVLVTSALLGVEPLVKSTWQPLSSRFINKFVQYWKYMVVVGGVVTGISLMAIDTSESSSSSNHAGHNTTSTSAEDSYSAGMALYGMFLVLTAAVMSGLRWAFCQKLMMSYSASEYYSQLQDSQELSIMREVTELEPIESPAKSESWTARLRTVYLLTPLMSMFLFVLALIIEHPQLNPSKKGHHMPAEYSNGFIVLLLSLPAPVAIAVIMSELTVLDKSSPFQLSLMGMLKECAGILVGLVVFHDHIGVIGWTGMSVVMASIWFNHHSNGNSSPHSRQTATAAVTTPTFALQETLADEPDDY